MLEVPGVVFKVHVYFLFPITSHHLKYTLNQIIDFAFGIKILIDPVRQIANIIERLLEVNEACSTVSANWPKFLQGITQS